MTTSWQRNHLFSPVGSHNDGTDISSATELTPPTGATKLLIQTSDQNVRFTLDGTTPTSSKGFKIAPSDAPLLIEIDLNTTITVIEEAATADIQYQWGK